MFCEARTFNEPYVGGSKDGDVKERAVDSSPGKRGRREGKRVGGREEEKRKREESVPLGCIHCRSNTEAVKRKA